jgi:hypothetical protein
MSRVRVTIDRLILQGFDPGDQRSLINGLKSELSRMLSDQAAGIATARSHRTSLLRAEIPAMEPGFAGARKLGGGIARAIGKGVKP